MTPELSRKLQPLIEQLRTEFRESRPVSERNPLALLDLLFGLRNRSAREPALASFHEQARKAVPSVIAVVESGKPFTSEQFDQLTQVAAKLGELWDTAASGGKPKIPESSGGVPEETPLVMNIAADGDILHEFLNEAHEHLDAIEQGVLELEKNPTDKDTLDNVFRAFHSFKGGAGFLNLVPINRVAHELESLLAMARKGDLRIGPQMIELILQGGDVLKQFAVEMEAQLSGKKTPAPFALPTEDLKARVRTGIKQASSGDAVPAKVEVATAPSPAPKEEQAPPAAPAQPEPPVAKPPASQPSTPPVVSAAKAPALPPETRATKLKTAAETASVKVGTQKLDALVDLVGELVIAQSFVAQHPDLKAITNQFFTRSLSQLNRITKELQRTAMSMRMVPIASTFQRMMRVVRDLAAKQQKQVQLVLNGEDTELDRTIVEEIGDPLMHMIRNSIDHGIEKPEERSRRGKPNQGRIDLRAYHESGNIVIQIQDDGNGLDRERILKKAIEKGLVASNEELTDSDIFQLIFAPGFSTAEVVTDISGRGVGMDVVKRNIEKLHGNVEIDSQPGQGSTFTIYLPLTLAIIDALVVGVGEERYIIPALAVRESFQLSAKMLATVYNRGEMVKVRDRLIPLLRLHEHFNIKPRSANPLEGIVIVLEAGRGTRCLLVDQLLNKQEVVIKNLGGTLKRNQALAGAAILGDGRVGLILDVNALVQLKPVILPIAA